MKECEDETFLQIFIYFQLLRALSMRGTTKSGRDKAIVILSRFRLSFYSLLTRLLRNEFTFKRFPPFGEFESFSVFIVESVNIVNLQYFLWPHPSIHRRLYVWVNHQKISSFSWRFYFDNHPKLMVCDPVHARAVHKKSIVLHWLVIQKMFFAFWRSHDE